MYTDAPLRQHAFLEVLIDKDDLWVLLWYGLPCLTIDEEELGWIFVDGELLQLDGQR